MKIPSFLLAASMSFFASSSGFSTAPQEPSHSTISPEEISWLPGPASLPEGAQIAILQGDISAAAPFTFRVKFPAGYSIQPHFHPKDEALTVISGSLAVGFGEVFLTSDLISIPAGGFTFLPAQHAHYIMTKEETVVQINAFGPWGITYINPLDDPRNNSGE
ncbi:cupin domain-containing protein [Oligoflexus tunisiensis]|uniref:cupin domain-containing protein n=1 Tax=Oligoflexus tunisiensis TaxID=708132 RepID=UPI001C4071DD|nr:cupin domain-containing protein [Oligoflexus tunisiensis]